VPIRRELLQSVFGDLFVRVPLFGTISWNTGSSVVERTPWNWMDAVYMRVCSLRLPQAYYLTTYSS
jgi:hypothetical protein